MSCVFTPNHFSNGFALKSKGFNKSIPIDIIGSFNGHYYRISPVPLPYLILKQRKLHITTRIFANILQKQFQLTRTAI